jgi:hypothetical protein
MSNSIADFGLVLPENHVHVTASTEPPCSDQPTVFFPSSELLPVQAPVSEPEAPV